MTFDEVDEIKERKFQELMRRGTSARLQSPVAEASGKPIELSDADFHAVIKSRPLMVVDFWAPWCGPCRMVSPVLEALSHEMAGKAAFGKLNVDENPQVSSEFGIQSIPTIVIFKDGRPVDGLVGAVPKAMIEEKIRPYVRSGSPGSPPRPYQ